MASEKTVQNCVEFKFQCPKRWDALKETPEPNIRACDTCARLVYFCASTEEAQAHAQVGHCVAIEAPASVPMRKGNSRLGELLLREKRITQDQLQKATQARQKEGGRVDTHLIKMGALTEVELLRFLSKKYDVSIIKLVDAPITGNVIRLVPREVAAKHQLIPINQVGGALVIAMVDPSDLVAIDDIKFLTGCEVRVVVAPEAAIEEAIERHYVEDTVTMGEMVCNPEPAPDADLAVDAASSPDDQEVVELEATDARALEEATRSGPIVRLIRKLLLQAIRKHATEVYIEPLEHGFRVLFKIEGIYQEEVRPPAMLKEPFIASLKVMAGLKVSERKKPQQGKLRLDVGDGQAVEFVVRTAPTPRGEEARVTVVATQPT